jgi:nucleoside-diphosphate-sugar epimerase
MKILILGINGFIGHRLTENILTKTSWDIYGMDLTSHRLENCLRYPRLEFKQGDLRKEKQWLEDKIAICDVVLPLAAIASPALYVQDPIRVFELDFEMNLEIIKMVLEAKKRLVFPSTSEVYGMCQDADFNEHTSNLVTGPIEKERWIYSASKQLLDRVIYAYGAHRGLKFTLFRPFNWIGPRQDEVFTSDVEHARVVTRFISSIIHSKDIILVNGGSQKRSFTYIDDGVEALMNIIENVDDKATGRIFNVGNPYNNISISELAHKIKSLALSYPKYSQNAERVRIISRDQEEVFGKSFEDIAHRVPSIENAKMYLNWEPKTDINIALNNILDFYLA